MLKTNHPFKYLFYLSVILGTLSSCKTQQVIYLKDVPPGLDKVTTVVPAEFTEPIIQVDDIMDITIQTIDPQSSSALNQTGASMPGQQASSTGYLVDQDGKVEIPMLGNIKLIGLTTAKARDLVRTEASKFYKNPTVQVRFSNFKFTIIGDVNRPGTFTIPTEKFSILDALGTASDLAISGKRDNVMLIRENNGKKEIVRLDLTSTNLLKSPYFYLKQNDVIYVEPGPVRVQSNNATNLRYYTLGLSLLSIAFTIFWRLNN